MPLSALATVHCKTDGYVCQMSLTTGYLDQDLDGEETLVAAAMVRESPRSTFRPCFDPFPPDLSTSMSLPVFIPITSTLSLPLVSDSVSSVYRLLRAIWTEQYLLLPKVEFSQLSLRALVKYFNYIHFNSNSLAYS